jgi:hypothetical protein
MPCRAGRLGLAKVPITPTRKGISGVKPSHTRAASSALFDDPNLVSSAELVPLVALADLAGLRDRADERLSVPTNKGANAGAKVMSLVAGMDPRKPEVPPAGADSIDDMATGRVPTTNTGYRAILRSAGRQSAAAALEPPSRQTRCRPMRADLARRKGLPGGDRIDDFSCRRACV